MSKLDWRWITRAGIGLVVVLGLAYLAGAIWFFLDYQRLHEHQRQEIASQEQRATDEYVDWRCNVLAALFGAECQPKDQGSEQANQYAEADLEAQQDMAEWALIVALVSVPGLIVSGLGLWALYWTFAQTREIAKTQERAVLSVYAIRMGEHNSVYEWMEIEFGIKNSGKTHAEKVYIVGRLDFDPGATEGQECGTPGSAPFVCHGISSLAGGESGVIADLLSQNFEWDLIGTSSKMYAMTGDCRRESITLSGFIHWTDVFGDQRKAAFETSIGYRSPSGDTWMSVGSNETAAKRFEEKYKKNS